VAKEKGGIDKRNVYGLGLVSLLNDAASEMIYPLLPSFLMTLGAGPAALGLIEGIAETTASVLKYLSGVFSDRTGKRKPIFVFGYVFSNIVRPLTALAASWWHVLFVRFADRIGKGVRTTPRDALLAESVPKGRRGWAFGIQRAMDHSGAVIGPAAATLLLASGLSMKTVFLLSAIPGVIVVLIVVFVVHERCDHCGVRDEGYLDSLSPKGLPKPFLWYLGAVTLFTLGNSTDAFLLLRAQGLGVPLALLPMLWIAFHVSKMLFSLAGGRFADRYGRRRGIFLGWGVYALVYAGFAVATSAWHAWGLFLGYGLFFGLTEGAERALVADFTAPENRGRAFGLFHFVVGIAALPASVVFGLVWNTFGAPVAFTMGACLAAAATIPLVVSKRLSSSAA
jgi:MFS family permease